MVFTPIPYRRCIHLIYQLAREHYERIQSLCQGLEYQLIITAVIENTSPGRVLVDHPDHPTSCFLSTAEGCFLAGDPHNTRFNIELGIYLKEKMTSTETEADDDKILIISCFPNDWAQKFSTLVPTKSPVLIPRRYYTCTKLKWQAPVPIPFTLQQINAELLARHDLVIPDHLTSWIQSNWGSQDAFLKRGFGFAMLQRNHVVSWSITDCVSRSRCEIGIRTGPEYQRQGLATLTAAATVDYGLHHGFDQIGWHTSEDNIGSIKVAEKVGFERSKDYIWYLFNF